MRKVRCHVLLRATIPPMKEILLGCHAQTLFKPMVVDAYAKTAGVKLFLSGSMFDVPVKTESMFQLESSIHGQALSVGEMLAFHLHNDGGVEATVVLKVSGYGTDVQDESCVNDPEQPVIADIRTRGLQRPVGQVYTSADWNRRLESLLIEGDGGVSITEEAFNQLSPGEQALVLFLRRFSCIESLISRSSLGSPEAVAIRASANPVLVQTVLARADELAKKRE